MEGIGVEKDCATVVGGGGGVVHVLAKVPGQHLSLSLSRGGRGGEGMESVFCQHLFFFFFKVCEIFRTQAVASLLLLFLATCNLHLWGGSAGVVISICAATLEVADQTHSHPVTYTGTGPASLNADL